MGVIDPEVADKAMNASTRSMRHSSAIGMRLWKMWREAGSQVSLSLFPSDLTCPKHLLCRLIAWKPR